MIDPATGLPLSPQDTFNPQKLSMDLAGQAAQGANVQAPLFYDLLEGIPGIPTATAWNMNRTANTLLGNKRKVSGSAGGRGFRQTFSPARFFSLANVENIDPVSANFRTGRVEGGVGKLGYSPFNFLAKAGNSFFHEEGLGYRAAGAAGRRATKISRALRGEDFHGPIRGMNFQAPLGRMAGGAPLSGSQQAFARGTLGRMAAAERINARNFQRYADNVVQASFRLGAGHMLDDASPFTREHTEKLVQKRLNYIMNGTKSVFRQSTVEVGGRAGTQGARTVTSTKIPFDNADKARALQSLIASTNTGRVSGKVAGFMQGMGGQLDGTLTAARTMTAHNPVVSAGVKSGANFAARHATLARTASIAARVGLRWTPVVGQVLLAYDLAALGGKIASRAAKISIEAAQSTQGDLTQSHGFGATYRDTGVAASARARAVNQIASSRLNARSMLGSEAGFVAARFG